jgi:hypothetical protein
MPDATPSQVVDKVIAAICGKESMDLLIIYQEMVGDKYTFLVDMGASLGIIKPRKGKGQKVNPVEFMVKHTTGTEIQAIGYRMMGFGIFRFAVSGCSAFFTSQNRCGRQLCNSWS